MDIKLGAAALADFDNAIIKALLLGYKVAYSNDAFELWFYPHYNFLHARHLRIFYYKELVEGMVLIMMGERPKYHTNLYYFAAH